MLSSEMSAPRAVSVAWGWRSKWSPKNADNILDPATAGTRTDTLKAGENNYAYVAGLADTSNPAFPLLADGFSGTIPTYDTNKSNVGGVWAAKKAVVIFCDASGQIMKVDAATKQVKRPGTTTGAGLFASAADWLDATNNPVINPQ